MSCGSRGGAGRAGGAGDADRVVEVRMVDSAFDPATFSVASGETVTFRFTNEGAVAHEAYIGDAADQAAHEEEMSERAHGGHAEESDRAITLDPGQDGELTWTFEEEGSIEIGCHEPGHYAAGMRASVAVS
jgi:uncharacterized cupredoxin-like copper-binding protein